MCYFLYGSLYGDIPKAEYESIQKKYEYKIPIGTKHDVKKAVKAAVDCVQDDYRITDWCCDCDSPIGKHDPNDDMIVELSNLITELSKLPGAKQINLCKTWVGRHNKMEVKLNLKDVDLPSLLADMQENTLYNLDL